MHDFAAERIEVLVLFVHEHSVFPACLSEDGAPLRQDVRDLILRCRGNRFNCHAECYE